jgi:hypothetical protein
MIACVYEKGNELVCVCVCVRACVFSRVGVSFSTFEVFHYKTWCATGARFAAVLWYTLNRKLQTQRPIYFLKIQFYIIMLIVSTIGAIIRQNLYKNMKRNLNIHYERSFSLTSIVTFVCLMT